MKMCGEGEMSYRYEIQQVLRDADGGVKPQCCTRRQGRVIRHTRRWLKRDWPAGRWVSLHAWSRH